MNKLINNLDKYKDNVDTLILGELINILSGLDTDNLDELKKYEDVHFTTDDIKLRNDMLFKSYMMDITHIEKLSDSPEIIKKLDDIQKLYMNETDEENKSMYIIMIYSLIWWHMPLPYQAYKLITKGKVINY